MQQGAAVPRLENRRSGLWSRRSWVRVPSLTPQPAIELVLGLQQAVAEPCRGRISLERYCDAVVDRRTDGRVPRARSGETTEGRGELRAAFTPNPVPVAAPAARIKGVKSASDMLGRSRAVANVPGGPIGGPVVRALLPGPRRKPKGRPSARPSVRRAQHDAGFNVRPKGARLVEPTVVAPEIGGTIRARKGKTDP